MAEFRNDPGIHSGCGTITRRDYSPNHELLPPPGTLACQPLHAKVCGDTEGSPQKNFGSIWPSS